MKHLLPILLAISAASSTALLAAEARPAVLARSLAGLQSAGKIKGAMWTLREDSCTLQLVLQGQPSVQKSPATPPVNVAPLPLSIQVWMLAADGSHIPAVRISPASGGHLGSHNFSSVETTYTYPRSACHEAVAVAISVGDDYYIEKLEPIPDQIP